MNVNVIIVFLLIKIKKIIIYYIEKILYICEILNMFITYIKKTYLNVK